MKIHKKTWKNFKKNKLINQIKINKKNEMKKWKKINKSIKKLRK